MNFPYGASEPVGQRKSAHKWFVDPNLADIVISVWFDVSWMILSDSLAFETLWWKGENRLIRRRRRSASCWSLLETFVPMKNCGTIKYWPNTAMHKKKKNSRWGEKERKKYALQVPRKVFLIKVSCIKWSRPRNRWEEQAWSAHIHRLCSHWSSHWGSFLMFCVSSPKG